MRNTLYLVVLTILISGCAKHSTNFAPKHNKIKKNSSVVKKHDKKILKKDLKQTLNKTKLSTDKEKIEAMNRVGNSLAKIINNHNFNWKFTLVESDAINATCFPNGHIMMTTGVFKAAKNDAQLATIISHEMAHVISKHGEARINRANILNGIEGIGVVIAGLINPLAILPFVATYEAGTKEAIILPSSRFEELEADAVGLKLMKKANYDIDDAYELWCNIKNLNKNKKHIKSTTHHSYDKRIKQIEKEIKKMKEDTRLALNTTKY